MSFLGFSARDVKKMIKEAFPFLLKEEGFKFYESDIIIRISEYVIQGIYFQGSQYSRWVALHPFLHVLIVPLDFLALSIGRRIPGHEGGGDYWYEFENALKAAESLSLMNKNLGNIVLPFLDDSKDIKTLADPKYQKKWRFFWGDSPTHGYKRCLLYAYSGRKKEFLQTFDKTLPIYEKEDRDWAKAEFKRLLLLRDNLDNTEKLQSIFKEYIAFSIKGLRLQKFGVKIPE